MHNPKISSYTNSKECNIIDFLRDQFNKFSPNDMVFIGGNFDCRIRARNDFIIENEKDLYYLPQDYELETMTSIRNSKDTPVNEYGQQLLDLCVETKLRF